MSKKRHRPPEGNVGYGKNYRGECAPNFTLPAASTGENVSLASGLSDNRGDTLLVFFRGTWCPFCREQMRVLKEHHALLTAANVRVLGVVCQNPSSVSRYLDATPVPFPVLVDESRSIAKAYGVHYYLSLEGVNLANPSIFIIDRGGVVTFAHVGRGMEDMPVTEVIERLAGFLNSSPEEGKV